MIYVGMIIDKSCFPDDDDIKKELFDDYYQRFNNRQTWPGNKAHDSIVIL